MKMKEEIYTIPVNEAYDTDEECPLCFLKRRLEEEGVEYALGAAMMEPDYRIKSNENGFCNKHFSEMLKKQNKLSLALILDTHLEEIRKHIMEYENELPKLLLEKQGLFKKQTEPKTKKITEFLHKVNNSCVICEHVDYTMERYIKVLFFMWQKDDDFKKKFDNSKGLCLEHFEALLVASEKYLNPKQQAEFLKALMKKQTMELERIQEDIHKFTLKFDYRNKDMEWGTAIDAPIRTVEKIAGFVQKKSSES